MCPDHTNELADISLGDAWLPELKHERIGESIVVVRTSKGEEFLSKASSSGVISLRPIECEQVKRSQAGPLKFKKDDLGTRLSMIESRGMNIPDFDRERNSSRTFSSFIRNFFAFFNIQAPKSGILKALLTCTPIPIFRLYYGIYKFLLLI